MKPIGRLYSKTSLALDTQCTLEEAQAHYLLQTLRGKIGAHVRLFNGRDGEWLASITDIGKKHCRLRCEKLLRAQASVPDIALYFAPIKNEKLDFLVMRACELGISAVQPVLTERTIVSRINLERMQKNLVEASEQCERLDVPTLLPETTLPALLGNLRERLLVHADESGAGTPIHKALQGIRPQPVAVLIGPEGGFSERERMLIKQHSNHVGVSLGPRILRAETAVITALAHVFAAFGDWDIAPRFGYNAS